VASYPLLSRVSGIIFDASGPHFRFQQPAHACRPGYPTLSRHVGPVGGWCRYCGTCGGVPALGSRASLIDYVHSRSSI